MRIPQSAIEIGVVIFAVRFIGGEAVFERIPFRDFHPPGLPEIHSQCRVPDQFAQLPEPFIL